jgi:hypothetical protein
MKPLIPWFHPEVLPLWVGYAASEDLFEREMKRMNLATKEPFILNSKGATTHVWHRDGIAICIVAVGKAMSRNGRMALAVHEAVHCWQECVKEMGETFPSDEFMAYTIQGISLFLFDHL